MDKETINELMGFVDDAISSMLQAIKAWDEGKAEINGEWTVRSCAGLNEAKIILQGELDNLGK
jgi:hypothetical protein